MSFWSATWGTWFNAGAVVLGGWLGRRFGHRLPSELQDHWRRWLGVITVLLGLRLAAPLLELELGPLPALLPALLLLLAGSAIGRRLNRSLRLPARLGGLREGVLPGAFVLFCAGPMTLLGCLRNGAFGDADLLLVKSSLDGVAAAVLAAGTDAALAWVAAPLLALQLPLSLAAARLSALISDPQSSPLVQFPSAVGGLMVLALALELLDCPAPSVSQAWPGLALAPVVGSWIR
ncbi:DUF554 family protein [Synechococcus sp. RSCCF101]|uniref:DUF554 family protein n=1 Tax=Synechococcus sp. RSCCF101 TaxID=2511069 RepID=UPI0012485677|nr:DUF554 family protein [Synechococcus sp. RSCCF101]QEY32049.1 DUF554 family protein [Synechococcus sp. RSCCF101]